jgi:hypothetical protein
MPALGINCRLDKPSCDKNDEVQTMTDELERNWFTLSLFRKSITGIKSAHLLDSPTTRVFDSAM